MRFEAQVKRAKSPLTYCDGAHIRVPVPGRGHQHQSGVMRTFGWSFLYEIRRYRSSTMYPGLPKPARQVNSQTAVPDFGRVPARVGSIQCFHLEPSWSARVRAVHQLRNGSKGTFCERMDDSVEPGTKEHFGGAVIITIARRTFRSAGAWLFPCFPCSPCRAASRGPRCA
jgi:hypothetical protein